MPPNITKSTHKAGELDLLFVFYGALVMYESTNRNVIEYLKMHQTTRENDSFKQNMLVICREAPLVVHPYIF
jgi:hypothetical protein